MSNIIIFQRYSSLLIVICFIIVSSVAVPAAFADREHESHGGRAPSERFRDENIKDGRHDPHLDHQAILGKIILFYFNSYLFVRIKTRS